MLQNYHNSDFMSAVAPHSKHIFFDMYDLEMEPLEWEFWKESSVLSPSVLCSGPSVTLLEIQQPD